MNILVAGGGKLGLTLVHQLVNEGHSVTLIDSNSEKLESSAGRYDVMTVQGNCASLDVLKEAGIEKADLLIAVTGGDEVNLLSCTTAHWVNPKLHTIARIRNPEYEDQAYSMRDAFALSMIVNPEKRLAAEIEKLLRLPGFLKRESFAKGKVEIVELKVEENSVLAGKPLKELPSELKCHVLVCSVIREGQAMIPSGHFVLQANDRIFVTAPAKELSNLLKSLDVMTHKTHKVMIVGTGRTSYYLADRLTDSRIDVKIVDKDREGCLYLASLLPQAEIVQGDPCNQAILESEGLSSCDALVTLTGKDETNMIVSLYGNTCGIPQIITKIEGSVNTDMLDRLELGSVVSPNNLCCNQIVRYVRAMQNQTGAAVSVHSIADGQAEAIEFRLDENTLHCGEPLKNLKLRPNVLLVSISNGEKTLIPNGDSVYEAGDSVVVVASSKDSVLLQFNDIFA